MRGKQEKVGVNVVLIATITEQADLPGALPNVLLHCVGEQQLEQREGKRWLGVQVRV